MRLDLRYWFVTLELDYPISVVEGSASTLRELMSESLASSRLEPASLLTLRVRPLARRLGAQATLSGGYSGGAPPVPIPNTEVKPYSADGTARETSVGE